MLRKLVIVTALLAVVGLVGLVAFSGSVLAQGPTATITSPTTGSTVGATLPISGTASGPNFSYYLVQFKLGDQWTLVDGNVHTTQVTTTGTLASWDTTKYADGSYDIRLLLADKGGQFITATVTVKVDNSKTPPPAAVLPNRGCTACHAQIAPDGRYSLAWEAMNADPKHPTLPNGFKSTYQDCMLCHAPKGTTGTAGVVAPIAMASIVHPVHLFSDIFLDEFKGNCFSCHNVDNGGNFAVLGEKITVNAHGIPTQ